MRAQGVSLAVLVLLSPASGFAETHKIRASAGGALTKGQSELWGGQLAIEFAPWNKVLSKPQRNRLRPFSLILEGAASGGSHEIPSEGTAPRSLSTRTQYSVLTGGRVTLGGPKSPAHVYVQGLIGHVTTHDKFTNPNGIDQMIKDKTLAWGGGVGADFAIPNTHGGLQVQVNILRRADTVSGDPDRTIVQASLGIMIKFEDEEEAAGGTTSSKP